MLLKRIFSISRRRPRFFGCLSKYIRILF